MWLITVLCIMAGFLFKKSKLVYTAQGLWIFMLLGFTRECADYVNYVRRYNSFMGISFSFRLFTEEEPFYRILQVAGNKLGLNYAQFFAAVMFFCVLLLMYVIWTNTSNPCFALSLFMIFPLYSWGIQVRFRIAALFIYLGLTAIAKNRKYKYVIYGFFWILASGTHTSMLIFGLFFFLYFNINQIKTGIISLLFFMFSAVIVLELFVSFDNTVITALYTYLLDANRAGFIKMLIMGIWQTTGFVFINYTMEFAGLHGLKDTEKRWLIMTKKISWIMLVLIPLYYYSIIFTRLMYFILIVYFIAMSIMICHMNFKRQYNKILFAGGFIGYITATFLYIDILWGKNFLTVVMPFYQNNMIFH